MVQALVLNNSTVVRATVIATRSHSEEIGIIKAMMIENLKTKLANGVAHFIYLKKDGTVREAWGTTKSGPISDRTIASRWHKCSQAHTK
jgi:hypothetical protein